MIGGTRLATAILALVIAACAPAAPDGNGQAGSGDGGGDRSGDPRAGPPPADSQGGASPPFVIPGQAVGDGLAEETGSKGAVRDRLRHLRALPYVEYDPDADVSLLGVTKHVPERSWPGYNLFTNEITQVYLIDNEARLVHRWRVGAPYYKCEHSRLLDDGTLLLVCVDMGLIALDWESNVLWEVRRKIHHDVDVTADGTILVPSHTRKTYQGRDVWFATLLKISMEGKVTGRWSAWDHLDEVRRHHPPSPLDAPWEEGEQDPLKKSLTGLDYHHMNSVEILPPTPLGERDGRFRAGNILISLRNVNLVLILDQDDESVLWSWGPGELELQHMPTMVPSGNILVFDNGTYRGWSRVIEVDPISGRIVWEYKGDPPESFYSKWRGSNQRLPNGNTLISESERGHVIEVTPDQEIVWEFWNPDLRFGARKRIYRMIREPVEKIDRLLATLGGDLRKRDGKPGEDLEDEEDRGAPGPP